jgi:hypothetical protein
LRIDDFRLTSEDFAFRRDQSPTNLQSEITNLKSRDQFPTNLQSEIKNLKSRESEIRQIPEIPLPVILRNSAIS